MKGFKIYIHNIMNSKIDEIFEQKKNELLNIYKNKTKNKKMTDDVDKLDYSTNKILSSLTKK